MGWDRFGSNGTYWIGPVDAAKSLVQGADAASKLRPIQCSWLFDIMSNHKIEYDQPFRTGLKSPCDASIQWHCQCSSASGSACIAAFAPTHES